MTALQSLFDTVRELCPGEAWSRGVTLARNEAVRIEASGKEELTARVSIQGSPLTPTVTLYLEDGEWECDCGSSLEACEHVAAALIASRQGTGTKARAARIEYRFRRSSHGLFFERGVTDERGFHPIEFPLEATAAGTFQGPRFEGTPEDLAVEKALRGRLRGVVDRGAAGRLLAALARVEHVELEGLRVRASREPVLPSVRVEDEGGGFRVKLAEPPGVTESFANGIVRLGDVLRPAGEPPLTGRELHDLSRGRVYREEETGELVSAVLPALRKKLPLDVRTERLPALVAERPRISLFLKREDDRLYVLSRIVYGDPPRARVEGDRLVALGGDVPIRDRKAERELEARLARELGLVLGRGEELSTEAAIELVQALETFPSHVEGSGAEGFRLHPTLEPRLRLREDDFELGFETGEKPPRAGSPASVLRAWREGRSLVPLVGGGFAPLPLDWLERYGDRLADLMAAREAHGELPRACLPELARLAFELDEPAPWGFEKLRDWVEGFSEIPEAPLSPELRAKLRDYQRKGVDWLVFLRNVGFGALLADDMGLGKTVQALCALEGRSLVAAPTSVLQNWIDEARRFRPELSICLYHGARRELDPEADLTVTSHALLRGDRAILSRVSWNAVVLDEAQAIKNPDTELARAAYELPARFRVSLTGTPIENRLVDLWSQFHFANPGFLGGLSDFEERYARPIDRGELEPLERLRERIRPFFLRRVKKEVAPELPPRTDVTLRSELSSEERELYEALLLAARKDVLAKLEAGGSVLAALEALLRLRQAACHPALVPGQEAPSSSKTELLLSSLDIAAAEGHKSLVFSQWTSMLDLLEPHLESAGLRFVRLDGSTRDRGAVVDRFQRDEGVSVFLISLKAGGTGLNLTAADHVFLFDPWWNPAVEEQAFDRAHRIGQDKPVFVHRLVAAETVEDRMLALQEEKRALAELASGAGAFTKEDLQKLLE